MHHLLLNRQVPTHCAFGTTNAAGAVIDVPPLVETCAIAGVPARPLSAFPRFSPTRRERHGSVLFAQVSDQLRVMQERMGRTKELLAGGHLGRAI